MEFRQTEGTSRTADDLRAAAEGLLKGCKQHFRSGVTRVSRIGGVIPLGQERTFRSLTEELLGVDDLESFRYTAQKLALNFPLILPWLRWWMREEHARMLFQSHRCMDVLLWDSLPDTTNAEEAMHWKIYSAVGRDHKLMEGLRCLQKFVAHYDVQIASAQGKLQFSQCDS